MQSHWMSFVCLATVACFTAHQPPEYQGGSVNLYIRDGGDSHWIQGTRSGSDVVAPLFMFTYLRLETKYEATSGTISLKAPGWTFRCRLGSRKATVNGKPVDIATVPRLQTYLPNPSIVVERQIHPGPIPYLPILTIARLRSYRVEYLAKYGDVGPSYFLHAPFSYRPILNVRDQHIVSPVSSRVGGLGAAAELFFGTSSDNEILAHVRISLTNYGERPYVASDEFLFVILADGTILVPAEAGRSATARTLSVVIEPGKSDSVAGGPWSFPSRRATVPIDHILYTDGRHHFDWRIRESRPN